MAPEVLDGRQVLAVQQDGTALVLWALREHFRIYRDVEFLKPLYNSIVIPCANWLLEHRDHHGLPKPSWDLWEERRGIHTFTVAATIGALKAAAEFARDMGAMDHEERFLAGARRMTDAMLEYLWVPEHERLCSDGRSDRARRLPLGHDGRCRQPRHLPVRGVACRRPKGGRRYEGGS